MTFDVFILQIYVGASPSGDFVGPESSELWNFPNEDTIFAKPAHFFLPFPQLVDSYRRKIMSRRRRRFHIKLSDDEEPVPSEEGVELDPTSVNFVPFHNVTLYMEYYPIGRLNSHLQSDFKTIPWLSFLSLLMQLVWMGGGDDPKTSPLHYDKFENIMIMIAGTKVFKLFPPSESKYLYGDELSRGGKLTATPIYFPGTKKIIDIDFQRLPSEIDPVRSHSTYTMIDLDHLNLTRFPLFKKANMITCTIHKGDLLYVPANWWHDVTSYDDEEGKSIGISHFYEPFYHIPGDTSKSFHHTLSEYYSHIREDGVNTVELCDEGEFICFHPPNIKKQKKPRKPRKDRGKMKGKKRPRTRRKKYTRSDFSVGEL